MRSLLWSCDAFKSTFFLYRAYRCTFYWVLVTKSHVVLSCAVRLTTPDQPFSSHLSGRFHPANPTQLAFFSDKILAFFSRYRVHFGRGTASKLGAVFCSYRRKLPGADCLHVRPKKSPAPRNFLFWGIFCFRCPEKNGIFTRYRGKIVKNAYFASRRSSFSH